MIAFSPPPYSSLITDRIDQAERTIHAIVTLSPDGVTGTARDHICAALSSVALEHLRAILLLVKSQECVGSAFALLRPLVESLVRAEWLLSCASLDQLNAIVSEQRTFPSFETMAKAVDAIQPETGYFTPFTGDVYGRLCGYTHSGVEQIRQRFAESEALEPTYTETQIASLLLQSTFHVMRHFVLLYSKQGLESIGQEILAATGDFDDPSGTGLRLDK